MQVIRAEAMGMCFGVRDAIAVTKSIADPSSVTIHGELVHNEQVNTALGAAGFMISGEVGRSIPDSPVVMITAHGVSNRERAALVAAGKTVIDTTCPLVRRAHDLTCRLALEGWFIVIAGKRGHVEVLGLSGDLDDYAIVETPEEAKNYNCPRIAVVCQTTLQPEQALAIAEAVRRMNLDCDTRLVDTICRPTRDRQKAMANLLLRCDAVVVVGGAHSNNTRQLVNAAMAQGKPVCHVQSAEQVDENWAAQYRVIGVTAGTSTPDDIIGAVCRRLQLIEPVSCEPVVEMVVAQ